MTSTASAADAPRHTTNRHASAASVPGDDITPTKTRARITGLFYLALAITGGISFPVIRPAIFDAAHPATTAANLVSSAWLAQLGIAMELGTVLTQALVALSFYWLFSAVHRTSAFGIAVFGVANALIILLSAICMSAALAVAGNPALAPGGDVAATVQLLYTLSGAAWTCGGLFFGLWLIPMGHSVVVSGWMPRLLGWLLIAGGIAYILSAFLAAVPDPSGLVRTVLGIIPSLGEVWMVFYLLIVGARAARPAPAERSPA